MYVFFHKCLLNSVGVGLGFIEPRAMIIAKALFHCIVCTRPSRQKSAFSSVGPLYWDVGPWPSPAQLGRPNMAQLGPTEPSLGQQLLQIANLSSFFFWQNRNVHDEGRAKWEHWTLLWHSYQQHGSPMHSKVQSLMQIKYIYYNPLQGNYRVELLHREISVVITGNVTFHEQKECGYGFRSLLLATCASADAMSS